MADSPLDIGDSGSSQKPIANRVAPDDGVSGLIFEACEHGRVTLLINVAAQRLPLANIVSGGLRAFVMGIVNVLDDSFSGVQNVGVEDVMEKEKQLVGSWGEGL